VVVRVNEALYDTARERLEEIARSRGLEARLVVLAEPDIALGDCRIEWADGGVVRDRAATQSAITEAVIRYVAARTLRSSEPRHE
jgi:flagellar assembly protein FliH